MHIFFAFTYLHLPWLEDNKENSLLNYANNEMQLATYYNSAFYSNILNTVGSWTFVREKKTLTIYIFMSVSKAMCPILLALADLAKLDRCQHG